MLYIRTAEKLQRTSVWFENLEGGLDYLKSVIIDDSLGICDQLEEDMQRVVDNYVCEWKVAVEDPVKRAQFKHFVNSDDKDQVELMDQRDQQRPVDWKKDYDEPKTAQDIDRSSAKWVKVASVSQVPEDGGTTFKYGNHQIAIFNFTAQNKWFASQNMCPHKREMVLSRGLLGDLDNLPKVACPLHKKTFSLETGEGLSDPTYSILTFPVKIEGDDIMVELPEESILDGAYICDHKEPCVVSN